jgi:hypothetical protein
MLQPIEPQLLCQITGGHNRVAAHARDNTAMMQMLIATMSAMQTGANKPSPMMQLLPALIAMKKGDKKGAITALLGGGGGGGDKKPA